MKINKKILVPVLALTAFAAVGVGSTYAIFTSKANTNIAVTAGKVSVTATVENVKLYSGVYNEDTGVYEVITQKMVQMTIQGVAYIIVFVLILIATRFIFIAFKIVDKLPLIGGINRAIGAVAGFVKGMVIVWIIFACVAMTVTTSFGQEIVQAIYASPLLIWLYENNLILTLLMNIL